MVVIINNEQENEECSGVSTTYWQDSSKIKNILLGIGSGLKLMYVPYQI